MMWVGSTGAGCSPRRCQSVFEYEDENEDDTMFSPFCCFSSSYSYSFSSSAKITPPTTTSQKENSLDLTKNCVIIELGFPCMNRSLKTCYIVSEFTFQSPHLWKRLQGAIHRHPRGKMPLPLLMQQNSGNDILAMLKITKVLSWAQKTVFPPSMLSANS
jgi:hypothetical protein